MIFGLGAALGWGLADLFAAVSGRRIGSWATVVLAQGSSALALTALVLVVRPSFEGLREVAPWVVATAILAVIAYAAVYRALEIGTIAIISPVLASYAVIPVLLAVVLLDETLSAVQIAGVTVTIAGAVLTSTDLRAIRAGTHTTPKGLVWAVVAAVLFGIATFVVGWASQESGATPVIWLSRTVGGVVLAMGAVAMRIRRGRAFPRPVSAPSLGIACALGAADLGGTLVYAWGAEVGLVSIVTAVSAIYPLIPVAGGVWFFGERPSPGQLVGVALVVGGLALLGIA